MAMTRREFLVRAMKGAALLAVPASPFAKASEDLGGLAALEGAHVDVLADGLPQWKIIEWTVVNKGVIPPASVVYDIPVRWDVVLRQDFELKAFGFSKTFIPDE